MPEVEVYIDWQGSCRLIGRLCRQSCRGRESVSFQYDDAWIAAVDHFPIEVSLKVGRGIFVPLAGREMFGTLGDSALYQWGRCLMRRAERRRAEKEHRAPRTLFEPNITWVCETVDALRETLAGMSSTCQFDPSVCGATAMRMHEFGRVRKLSRNGKLSGEEEAFVRRLYVHVFYSPDSDTRKQLSFRKELLGLKAQVEDGVMEFTKSAQRKIDRYLICSKKGRGGQLKVGFNDKAIVEAMKYFGYFALVSNQAMKTFTALEDYRLREKIEEIFSVVKGGLDGARPRTWHPDNLRGRQFVQFVSLGYHCFLTKKIKEMRAELGKNGSEKTKALVQSRKKIGPVA